VPTKNASIELLRNVKRKEQCTTDAAITLTQERHTEEENAGVKQSRLIFNF